MGYGKGQMGGRGSSLNNNNNMDTNIIGTNHRLSGGETPISAEMQRLRSLIEAAPDVHRLLSLTEMENGRFAYLIQTPFATFPKFVVGTTDAENTAPEVLLKCGAQWSAENKFNSLINQ